MTSFHWQWFTPPTVLKKIRATQKGGGQVNVIRGIQDSLREKKTKEDRKTSSE